MSIFMHAMLFVSSFQWNTWDILAWLVKRKVPGFRIIYLNKFCLTCVSMEKCELHSDNIEESVCVCVNMHM